MPESGEALDAGPDGGYSTGAWTGDPQDKAKDPDELTELVFADLVRAQQVSILPTPRAGTPMLPLGELNPEVLERLAAEMIKRRLNDGAHERYSRAPFVTSYLPGLRHV